MKILHVVHGWSASQGGVERYLHQLVRAQRDAGLAPSVLAGSMDLWPRCGVQVGTEGGIVVARLHRDDLFFDWHGKAWHPGVEALVGELLARERPDLVHVHHWIRLTANLIEVAAAQGVPAVLTLHDAYASCPRAFRVDRDGRSCQRPLSPASCLWCVPRYGHESAAELAEGIALFADQVRSEILRAAAVLTPDAAVAELVARELGVPRDAFTVLPLPYWPRLAAGAAPARAPVGASPLRFGYFGHLARHKGVGVLVDAFAALCREGPPRPIHLHLFGSAETPAFAGEVRARAAGLPVTIHGEYTMADLAAAGLHCAVFPSLAFETFGFVLDEAFELGLPVVVSDLGALSRRAGGAAVRVPPGDAAALGRALRELAADPARLDALAARIPPPPPPLAVHVEHLLEIYRAARAAPPRAVAGVDPRRRAAFLLQQRESALRCITPEGGPR